MDENIVAVLMTLFILLLTFSVPLIGIIGGRLNVAWHRKSLDEREIEFDDFVITQIKSFPGYTPGEHPPMLICAETVIASDYLKTLFATIRGIFGGEVKSYQDMQERARRETLLRLVEKAHGRGYNAICNVRLETADVGGGAMTRGKKAMPMAAILGSATAYMADVR